MSLTILCLTLCFSFSLSPESNTNCADSGESHHHCFPQHLHPHLRWSVLTAHTTLLCTHNGWEVCHLSLLPRTCAAHSAMVTQITHDCPSGKVALRYNLLPPTLIHTIITESSQFCSNWAQVLLAHGTSNPDPFFLRQAVENYKLKVSSLSLLE